MPNISNIERWTPTSIMTTKGESMVVKTCLYPPTLHPTRVVLSHLFRVDLHCLNGKTRSFGFVNARIDSYLRVRVSGYSESFEEIKEWEVAKDE